jgi:hypothetical protein
MNILIVKIKDFKETGEFCTQFIVVPNMVHMLYLS